MSCNYQETDATKISRDIEECKASGKRVADLAQQIQKTIQLNQVNYEKYNRDSYLWSRAESQLSNNVNTIKDRIKKIEAERQPDWGTRCGVLGQYDYHCQLGNFLNQELYPQLTIHQKRYSDFIATFPKPTYNPLPVPNFDNTMVCQACAQCVNQSGNMSGGNINTSIDQINNCTINLEKKLENIVKTPRVEQDTKSEPGMNTEQNKSSIPNMIYILIFIIILLTGITFGVYYYTADEEIPIKLNK